MDFTASGSIQSTAMIISVIAICFVLVMQSVVQTNGEPSREEVYAASLGGAPVGIYGKEHHRSSGGPYGPVSHPFPIRQYGYGPGPGGVGPRSGRRWCHCTPSRGCHCHKG